MTIKELIALLSTFPENHLVSLNLGNNKSYPAIGVEESFNTDEWAMTQEAWTEYLNENPQEAQELGEFAPNGITIFSD